MGLLSNLVEEGTKRLIEEGSKQIGEAISKKLLKELEKKKEKQAKKEKVHQGSSSTSTHTSTNNNNDSTHPPYNNYSTHHNHAYGSSQSYNNADYDRISQEQHLSNLRVQLAEAQARRYAESIDFMNSIGTNQANSRPSYNYNMPKPSNISNKQHLSNLRVQMADEQSRHYAESMMRMNNL